MLDKMNQELDAFSVTLNKKHFETAVQLKDKIKQNGFEEPQFKIHASEIYKKSFTFPQIAHNDFAVEQFDTLAQAETQLDSDLANETAMESFVKSADDVAHNLKDRYKEQWVDPKDDRQAAVQKETTDY